MDVYKVFEKIGNENQSGQPVECMVGVHFEMTLDLKRVNGVNLPANPYVAKVKIVGFKDKDAFLDGKLHDPTCQPQEVSINISENPELITVFSGAFATLAPYVAAALGAVVVDVEFENDIV